MPVVCQSLDPVRSSSWSWLYADEGNADDKFDVSEGDDLLKLVPLHREAMEEVHDRTREEELDA